MFAAPASSCGEREYTVACLNSNKLTFYCFYSMPQLKCDTVVELSQDEQFRQ